MSTSTILSDNGVSSGTSGIKTSGGNDGVLLLQTTTAGGTATTAVTIDTGQRTTFPTTIAVGAATPSTSGSGITFPATQSASTDANTLDDYEEGTWTPAFSSTSATFSYASQVGYYTKVGRLVNAYCYLELSGAPGGTTTNALKISGLPFTMGNSTNEYAGIAFGQLGKLIFPAGANQLDGYTLQNTTTIALEWARSNNATLSTVAADLGSGAYIMVNVTYRASA